MNTELQAIIDAGRKLIAESATAEQRNAARSAAEAEAERLESIHLAKLPAWMHKYVTVTHWDLSVRIGDDGRWYQSDTPWQADGNEEPIYWWELPEVTP